MIHTLTLNPTLDLTYEVTDFRHDDTNRASAVFRAPGGKGINVSRVATRLGHATVALGFLGGHTGLEVAELLAAEHVPSWFLPIPGITRTNPIIQDVAGRELRISAPGPAVEEAQVQALWTALFSLRPPDWLLASGSLMPGVPADFFPRLLRHAQAQGIPTVVDADGTALEQGVAAGAALIKPNRYELERLVGRPLPTLDDVWHAAEAVRNRGVAHVAVSLGADGALLVGHGGTWYARPPTITVQSAVGAGDSLLAALCARLAEGDPPGEALRAGVACGAATAMQRGTSLCDPAALPTLLARTRVQRVEGRVAAD